MVHHGSCGAGLLAQHELQFQLPLLGTSAITTSVIEYHCFCRSVPQLLRTIASIVIQLSINILHALSISVL